MDVAIFQDLFGALLFTSICLLPLAVLLLFIYSTVLKLWLRSAHEKLGKALGFQPLNRAGNTQLIWYGGQAQGRDVAINTFTSTHQYYALERRRTGFNTELRLAMAIHLTEPLGVTAYRNDSRDTPQIFEEAFTVEQGILSPAAHEAMLAFTRLGHKTGLKRDLRVALTPGLRELRLLDRASAPNHLLGDGILADAKTILVHDHPFADVSPAELKAILEELGAVAEAIETDVVPPLLAGQTTPPPEWRGKYYYRAIMVLVFGGIPTCLCLCGMFNAFLSAYR